MVNCFLVQECEPEDIPFVYYKESEVRTIHRTFGHASIKSTDDLLRRANKEDLERATKEAIGNISQECGVGKFLSAAPRRFKLTVGNNDLRFNHAVQGNTMFIHNQPVLQKVGTAITFCAASVLRSQSATDIWNTILLQWSLVFVHPPEYLMVGQ